MWVKNFLYLLIGMEKKITHGQKVKQERLWLDVIGKFRDFKEK